MKAKHRPEAWPEPLTQMLQVFQRTRQRDEEVEAVPFRVGLRCEGRASTGPRPVARRNQPVAIQDLWKQG